MANVQGIIFKTKNIDKPPPGALRITGDEVKDMQWDLVRSWKPVSEVWSLRYGHMAASGLSAFTSFFISNYYRKKLHLGSFGRIPIHIAGAFVPSFFLAFTHHKFIVRNIFLQSECPVCIQVRSAALQVGLSVGYPLIVAPVTAFVYSLAYGTYRLPEINWKNRNELIQIYMKMTKRYSGPITTYVVISTLAATVLTYMQGTAFYRMQMKIINDRLATEELIDKKLAGADMLK